MRRIVISVLLALVFAGGGALVWRNLKARTGVSISASGGEVMTLMLPDTSGTYMQNDPRWGADKLGATSQTLAGVGCTVCSVAMACTNLGESRTPKELNEQLSAKGGFTGAGWLVWGVLPQITEGHIHVEVTSNPSHQDLDRALKRGAYPVVKFVLPHGVPHWVVIVGKEGLEYLARDPLRRGDKPVRLSALTSRIYSARFIQRKS